MKTFGKFAVVFYGNTCNFFTKEEYRNFLMGAVVNNLDIVTFSSYRIGTKEDNEWVTKILQDDKGTELNFLEELIVKKVCKRQLSVEFASIFLTEAEERCYGDALVIALRELDLC